MSAKLEEVVLKTNINPSTMSDVLDPISSVFIFKSSLSEIEEFVFEHLLELELEYPDYSDFKYVKAEHKDEGIFYFKLIGIAKPQKKGDRNPYAIWISRDGSHVKIADMDLPYLRNCINYCNKRILEKPTESKEWDERLKLLIIEQEYRDNNSKDELCF